MVPNNNVPDLAHLEHVIEVLGRGDWRAAAEELRRAGDAGDQEAVVGVLVCLRCVCRCMTYQCATGDVERALGELDRAASTLGRLGVRTVRGGRLPVEPVREELPLRHLIWATDRLVLRERADLEAIRLVFGDLERGSRELVYACVEYLTWVEFDPWTVRVHPRDQELLGLDDHAYARFRIVNRRDISMRATNLRHLAAVRDGSVSERTWSRMGGDAAVRERALLVLAKEPVTRGRPDCPVRFGRTRARKYARRWAKDTAA